MWSWPRSGPARPPRDGDLPAAQYLWDQRYIDAPVLRWRDADGSAANGLEETLYYCNDANMNVTALVDQASGEVVERNTYASYGEPTFMDCDWQLTVVAGFADGAASAVANSRLFTGHPLDFETGLILARRRYDHPTMGGWVGRDIPYIDGMNLYGYCTGNPQNLLDAQGTEKITAELKAFGVPLADFGRVSVPQVSAEANLTVDFEAPSNSSLKDLVILSRKEYARNLSGVKTIEVWNVDPRTQVKRGLPSGPGELQWGSAAKIRDMVVSVGAMLFWRYQQVPATADSAAPQGQKVVCARRQFAVLFSAEATVNWTLHRIKSFRDQWGKWGAPMVDPTEVAYQAGSEVRNVRQGTGKAEEKLIFSKETDPKVRALQPGEVLNRWVALHNTYIETVVTSRG